MMYIKYISFSLVLVQSFKQDQDQGKKRLAATNVQISSSQDQDQDKKWLEAINVQYHQVKMIINDSIVSL